MKRIASLGILLLISGCASNVRVYDELAEMPPTCQLRIGVEGIQTFSPKVAALGLKEMEIRVLGECKKTTAKLGLNAFVLKGFAKHDEPNGAVSMRCTGNAYECK